MGRWGSRVLNFLVKIHIQLFVLQTSSNVLKHISHKVRRSYLAISGCFDAPKISYCSSLTKKCPFISKIIPLPVPNWASAEEQFIPNYPPQITIYSKFFFENPNFSLSTILGQQDPQGAVKFKQLRCFRPNFSYLTFLSGY